jgi:hypothetical protein
MNTAFSGELLEVGRRKRQVYRFPEKKNLRKSIMFNLIKLLIPEL